MSQREDGGRESSTLGSRMFIPSSTREVLLLLILYLRKKEKATIGVKSPAQDIRNLWVKHLHMAINWTFFTFNHLEIQFCSCTCLETVA